MKRLYIFSLLIIFSCKTRFHDPKIKEKASQPNIVVFIVDDMGWQDTSVPFWQHKTKLNHTYHTPNMESMARQGMKFTQAYTSSVCSPSRVSLMTGSNAARHRVTNWTLQKNTSTDSKDKNLIFPNWNVNGMSPFKETEHAFYSTPLPQILMDAGYHTIHIGKAHFGAIGTPAANPNNIGFQVNIAGHAGGGLQSYYGKDNFGTIPNKTGLLAVPGLEEFHGKDIFITEALTQKALQELNKRPKDKPFFLYLSHYAVHTPIMPDPRFIDKYLKKGIDSTEAAYATLVEGVDKSLGDILGYLNKNNLLDNTIVFFLSDNGGLDLENYGRKGEPNTHNYPLSSGKGSAYEGGVRVPMMALWKGKIKEGSSTNHKLIIEDYFPTILELANIKNYKTVQKVDGISFAPTLKGEESIKKEITRPLLWHMPNRWINDPYCNGIAPTSTLRQGDYKLIYYYNNQNIELFNIKNDISEENNLIISQPYRAKTMAKKLTQLLKEMNAQIPKDANTNHYIPYPDGTLKNDSL